MKKHLLFTTLLIAFQSAQATLPPKPTACPAASAIQAVGIQTVIKISDKEWGAGVQADHYGTTDEWTFGIRDIKAKDEAEARANAEAAIRNMSVQIGPLAHANPDGWGCLYKNDKGYYMFTITPALSPLNTVLTNS